MAEAAFNCSQIDTKTFGPHPFWRRTKPPQRTLSLAITRDRAQESISELCLLEWKVSTYSGGWTGAFPLHQHVRTVRTAA
eukprot:5788240-Pleurochrysis_carterae.AAC.1